MTHKFPKWAKGIIFFTLTEVTIKWQETYSWENGHLYSDIVSENINQLYIIDVINFKKI